MKSVGECDCPASDNEGLVLTVVFLLRSESYDLQHLVQLGEGRRGGVVERPTLVHSFALVMSTRLGLLGLQNLPGSKAEFLLEVFANILERTAFLEVHSGDQGSVLFPFFAAVGIG